MFSQNHRIFSNKCWHITLIRALTCCLHREEPFVFQIGRRQMNEGWEKGLLNMCVGEKRKLVVPSGLAYGDIGGL